MSFCTNLPLSTSQDIFIRNHCPDHCKIQINIQKFLNSGFLTTDHMLESIYILIKWKSFLYEVSMAIPLRLMVNLWILFFIGSKKFKIFKLYMFDTDYHYILLFYGVKNKLYNTMLVFKTSQIKSQNVTLFNLLPLKLIFNKSLIYYFYV